jgi:hypothetical protein
VLCWLSRTTWDRCEEPDCAADSSSMACTAKQHASHACPSSSPLFTTTHACVHALGDAQPESNTHASTLRTSLSWPARSPPLPSLLLLLSALLPRPPEPDSVCAGSDRSLISRVSLWPSEITTIVAYLLSLRHISGGAANAGTEEVSKRQRRSAILSSVGVQSALGTHC